jgi:hypothetical protein
MFRTVRGLSAFLTKAFRDYHQSIELNARRLHRNYMIIKVLNYLARVIVFASHSI